MRNCFFFRLGSRLLGLQLRSILGDFFVFIFFRYGIYTSLLFLSLFLLFYPLLIEGVISIPFGPMLIAIKSQKFPLLVNLQSLHQSLRKVGVTDIESAKADHISPAIPDRNNAFVSVKRIIPNNQATKIWA